MDLILLLFVILGLAGWRIDRLLIERKQTRL